MARPAWMRKSKRSWSNGPSKRRNVFKRYRAPSAFRQKSWVRPNVYWFKRAVPVGDIAFTTTGGGGLIEFKLNQLPNYTEYTTMFDAYRINKVVLEFKPNFIETNVNSSFATTGYIPDIGVVIDYDSQSAAPTSMNELRQYSNFREYKANKPFKVVLVPRTAGMVYNGAASTAYSQSRPRLWLDCEYPAVPHYGVNYYAAPCGANNLWNIVVTATFYIACKGTR